MRKIVFFTIFTVLLLLVPITLLQVTPWAAAVKNPARLTNFIQRFIGLAAFVLLFVQLNLGAFMDKLVKRVGSWVFKYHAIEGVVIYFLALLHALSFLILNHFIGAGWNPYFVFIDVCLLCESRLDYYYTLGRISFWLLSVAVFAGLFRKVNPWMKKNWRKLHVINYAVFLIVGAHGFLIGHDFRIQPFYSFALVAYALVLIVALFIELPKLYKNYKSWLRS